MDGAPSRYLPYGRQAIDEADIAAVADVLRGAWLTTGPAVVAFEAGLAEALAVPHAVACSNGTAALHLACLALGIGPGDAAIVPSITFVATANAARMTGAEVVFADVDPDSGLTGPAELEAALARAAALGLRPRVVLPVHLAGQCGDLAAMAHLARGHGLAIVEDACHAIGGAYARGDGSVVPIGSCADSDLAVFSFHPVKTIATGEGGAVTTRDAALARRLELFRSHGITREPAEFADIEMGFERDGVANPWYYEMPEFGWNYRLSDIHAALGLSQLGRMTRFVAERRRLAALYDAALAPLANSLRPIERRPGCHPAWHLYPVLVDFAALGFTRAALMGFLHAAGIGSQVHYIPVHRQPYYRARYGALELPGADAYYARALSLPLFVGMGGRDVAQVAGVLSQALAELPGRVS